MYQSLTRSNAVLTQQAENSHLNTRLYFDPIARRGRPERPSSIKPFFNRAERQHIARFWGQGSNAFHSLTTIQESNNSLLLSHLCPLHTGVYTGVHLG